MPRKVSKLNELESFANLSCEKENQNKIEQERDKNKENEVPVNKFKKNKSKRPSIANEEMVVRDDPNYQLKYEEVSKQNLQLKKEMQKLMRQME